MKILVTEQQLKSIIKESINLNRLNQILDKISAGETLTPEEKEDLDAMATGKNIPKRRHQEVTAGGNDEEPEMGGFDLNMGNSEDEREEPEEMFENDPQRKFIGGVPGHVKIDVDNEEFDISNTMKPKLYMRNPDRSLKFLVTPFFQGDKIKVECKNNKTKVFKITGEIPETSEQMEEFANRFFNQMLPAIIRGYKNTY